MFLPKNYIFNEGFLTKNCMFDEELLSSFLMLNNPKSRQILLFISLDFETCEHPSFGWLFRVKMKTFYFIFFLCSFYTMMACSTTVLCIKMWFRESNNGRQRQKREKNKIKKKTKQNMANKAALS